MGLLSMMVLISLYMGGHLPPSKWTHVLCSCQILVFHLCWASCKHWELLSPQSSSQQRMMRLRTEVLRCCASQLGLPQVVYSVPFLPSLSSRHPRGSHLSNVLDMSLLQAFWLLSAFLRHINLSLHALQQPLLLRYAWGKRDPVNLVSFRISGNSLVDYFLNLRIISAVENALPSLRTLWGFFSPLYQHSES